MRFPSRTVLEKGSTYKPSPLRSRTESGSLRRNIITNNKKQTNNAHSIIYNIPCSGCSAAHIGETSRGAQKRIYEHKNDLRHHRTSNSLVIHARDKGHLPNWKDVMILHTGKKRRKTIEAAYITTEETTNHREGFVCLSRAAAPLSIPGSRRRAPIPTNSRRDPPKMYIYCSVLFPCIILSEEALYAKR